MSNLREQIRKELTGVAQRVELRIRTGSWDDNTYQDPDEATSRIMALIAEAMLSDQAVDELVTLVAQGSRNPIAMMNARAMVKSIIARLLASPTGEEAGE